MSLTTSTNLSRASSGNSFFRFRISDFGFRICDEMYSKHRFAAQVSSSVWRWSSIPIPVSTCKISASVSGMGMLDHHQTDEDTCAAKRCLEYISSQIRNPKDKIQNRKKEFPDEALERLVEVVNDIDHFREAYFPNPMADFYDFGFVAILDGLKLLYPDDDHKLVEVGLVALDGIY